jgi:hypothetical protein
VTLMSLALADPEIAAATFEQHLNQLWASGRPTRLGWERIDVDPLHVAVRLPAKRPTGECDLYYFRLGAEYYDAGPPTVALVHPDGKTHASKPTQWFPVLEALPHWFGLHSAYDYPGGQTRQLICFSFAAEYYMTAHSPKETESWQQGRHTVAATLSRLAEILSPQYYRRPSA